MPPVTYETDEAARKPRAEYTRGLTIVGEAWDYMGNLTEVVYGDLHLLKAPSIIKHQAMIKARSRQRHRLLVISGIAVQPYRYSSALHARGGRG